MTMTPAAPTDLSAPPPDARERARLRALRGYEVLDTPDEAAFDRVVALARAMFGTPIAQMSLVDERRAWAKACAPDGPRDCPREWSFCTHAVQDQDVMVVLDASGDPRFAQNPFVAGPAHVRFYAGAPLRTPDGHNLGTLCVAAPEPRPSFDEEDRQRLQALADIVMSELELRRRRRGESELVSRLLETSSDCIKILGLGGTLEFVNGNGLAALEADDPAAYRGRSWPGLLAEGARARAKAAVDEARAGRTARFEVEAASPAGARWWDVTVSPILGEDGRPERLLVISRDVTERRRAEAEARNGEALFRTLAETIPKLVVLTDARGAVRYANSAFAAYAGLPAEGLMGDGWLAVLHPDDAGRVAGAWTHSVRGTAPFEVEARLCRADGEPRWHVARGRPMRGGDGAVTGWVVACADIHATVEARELLAGANAELERRVEAALAERKLWADVFESSDAPIAAMGPDHRFLAVNRAHADAFERAYGVRPRAGDSLGDLLGHLPEERARALAGWDRALAGEDHTLTAAFGDPGRERTHFELRFNVLRDREGRRIGAFLFSHDVTERLRAQAELQAAEAARRESDALYRAYFHNSAENLFVIGVLPDGGFSIEEINPAHERSTGLQVAELRGKRLEEQLPPALAAAVTANYRRAVGTGGVQHYRESHEFGGEMTHWDTVLVPVRDGGGAITRIVGSSRDMTAQVKAQAELHQVQKLETIGQLTGGVAHDFNNLLTPILGALDIIGRRASLDAHTARLLDGALQSAERAKTLVARLLAFARRQALAAQAVDVAALIEGMTDLVQRSIGPQIRVLVEAAPGLPPACVDPNQLELAILNLAVNARDAMEGGGTLTVAAHAERVAAGHPAGLAPGAYVRLSVIDTGAGMDEATLARAVEPFFSTKGQGKGTGLGLSMVHGLAAQSGGRLFLASAPGRGTRAEVWLPVADGAAAAAVHVVPEPRRARRPACVLLVDDEELVRQGTSEMLRGLGYDVVEAPGGAAALGLLRSGLRFDLLVTDYLMPGQTGTALAAAARALRPGLPALLITGYANVGDDEAGHLPRLAKPFREADLAARVAELVEADGKVVRLPVRAAARAAE